jgi:hypothetical protein
MIGSKPGCRPSKFNQVFFVVANKKSMDIINLDREIALWRRTKPF